MKLEHSLVLKDEVIRLVWSYNYHLLSCKYIQGMWHFHFFDRQFEGATTRVENMEMKNLKEDLRTTRIEIQYAVIFSLISNDNILYDIFIYFLTLKKTASKSSAYKLHVLDYLIISTDLEYFWIAGHMLTMKPS